MKRAILFLVILLTSEFTKSQIMWQFNLDTVVTWHYQEGDEFNGTTVNTNYWNYIIWARSLYMNKEQQYYTDGQNHQVDHGSLKLIAKKEDVFRKIVDNKGDSDSLFAGKKFVTLNKTHLNYTSGRLTTKGTFNKGYYECRFKIPSESGYWPAFWLHGGAPNEEIDIMESETGRPQDIHVDTHCPNHCDMVRRNLARESFGAWIKTKTNFSNRYNVIACEWDEATVKFFLNGEFIAVSKVDFDIPKHLTINIAVPSDGGPFGPGPQGADTSATFEIDYIRVWSKEKKGVVAADFEKSFLNADTSESVLTSSIMKKTGKSYYGKKQNARNEGIKISMFREGNKFHFTVLGNTRTNDPELSIVNSSSASGRVKKLTRVDSDLDCSDLEKGDYQMMITWMNKKAIWPFSIN